MGARMKTKTIHCRLTEADHQTILEAAAKAGLSITQFVIRAALGQKQAS